MTKIAIVQCKNLKEDLVCSSLLCFNAFNERSGEFSRYENPQITGIISCAGCPTIIGPDKFRQRIEALAKSGIEAIHLSSCMVGLCPYKDIYVKLIKEDFPDLEVVLGTHHYPSNLKPEEFVGLIKSLFNADNMNVDKAVNQLMAQ